MAHLYDPQHVIECKVSIAVKLSNGGSRNEDYTFLTSRDGRELTNQVTDTVLSALHLACSVKRERNADDSGAGQ
jgi:hypothetical protein